MTPYLLRAVVQPELLEGPSISFAYYVFVYEFQNGENGLNLWLSKN